jgi:hypothetical protein
MVRPPLLTETDYKFESWCPVSGSGRTVDLSAVWRARERSLPRDFGRLASNAAHFCGKSLLMDFLWNGSVQDRCVSVETGSNLQSVQIRGTSDQTFAGAATRTATACGSLIVAAVSSPKSAPRN